MEDANAGGPPGGRASEGSAGGLEDLITEVLARHRGVLISRLGVLEEAVAELRAGRLRANLREDARAAAHTLAGSLGTLGLDNGTELARGLERLLDAGDAEAARAASGAVAELRRLLGGSGAAG